MLMTSKTKPIKLSKRKSPPGRKVISFLPTGVRKWIVILNKFTMIATFLIFGFFYLACAGPIEGLYPPGPDEPKRSVYIINHNDWHMGIVIRREDIPAGLWPDHTDFPESEYLEVGWGDREYYQAQDPTVWMAFRAALWPSESVLHIVGFSSPVEEYFPTAEIAKITLSQHGFERLCAFIQQTYARDKSGKAIPLGPGLYGDSRFYLARGKFHLLRTCNVWIAQAIRSSGFPITPLYALTARNVMYQIKKNTRIITTVNTHEEKARIGATAHGE